MKRDQAISAIDDAAAQRIGNLFQVFISNMIADPANAPKEFTSGIVTRQELGNNISAYIASATMGCSNIEITSAIMRDIDQYAPRATSLRSTQAMRDRIRELMSREQDDYDRAVEYVLDDLEKLLSGSAHQPQETCERCQGNGEIVTDWDRYMTAYEGDVGDEAAMECPDCDGEGKISSDAHQPQGGDAREDDGWDGLDCACGGGWKVGHAAGCPEATTPPAPVRAAAEAGEIK